MQGNKKKTKHNKTKRTRKEIQTKRKKKESIIHLNEVKKSKRNKEIRK